MEMDTARIPAAFWMVFMTMMTMPDTFLKTSDPSCTHLASILHWPSQAIENTQGKIALKNRWYVSCIHPVSAPGSLVIERECASKTHRFTDSDWVNHLMIQ